MRHLNSEHISIIATWLWGNSNCDPKLAVERAIAIQAEAQKQCEAFNKKVDAEENRNDPGR
jgi:hypothetical protein